MKMSAPAMVRVALPLLLVAAAMLAVACQSRAFMGRSVSANPAAPSLAARVDQSLGAVSGAVDSLQPSLVTSTLGSRSAATLGRLDGAMSRFVPPAPQCFIAGFSGWDSDDFEKDSSESQSERVRFNDSSGTWQTMLATAGLHDGALHMYRYYEWKKTALPEIIAAAQAGQPIVLMGHSAGGAAALSAAWELDALGLPVALLMEFDTYTGGGWLKAPSWVYRDGRDAPANVERGLNFYQREWWLYKGRSQTWLGQGEYENIKLDMGHGGIDSAAGTMDVTLAMLREACGGTQPAPPVARSVAEVSDAHGLAVTLRGAHTARTEESFRIYAAACTEDGCGPYRHVADAPAETDSLAFSLPGADVGQCYAVSAVNATGESPIVGSVAADPAIACP
jgi:hypothetical protein